MLARMRLIGAFGGFAVISPNPKGNGETREPTIIDFGIVLLCTTGEYPHSPD
jgi:hypothetical protein